MNLSTMAIFPLAMAEKFRVMADFLLSRKIVLRTRKTNPLAGKIIL